MYTEELVAYWNQNMNGNNSDKKKYFFPRKMNF